MNGRGARLTWILGLVTGAVLLGLALVSLGRREGPPGPARFDFELSPQASQAAEADVVLMKVRCRGRSVYLALRMK